MLSESRVNKFKNCLDREAQLFQWVKQDQITVKEFRKLLEISKQEEKKAVEQDELFYN